MGPNAHCKHVRALLHALILFVDGKGLCLEMTCTDSLQTFHHPKQRHYGSPVKAQNLNLSNVNNNSVIFDPTLVEFIETAEQLNCRIRNETTVLIFQVIANAVFQCFSAFHQQTFLLIIMIMII